MSSRFPASIILLCAIAPHFGPGAVAQDRSTGTRPPGSSPEYATDPFVMPRTMLPRPAGRIGARLEARKGSSITPLVGTSQPPVPFARPSRPIEDLPPPIVPIRPVVPHPSEPFHADPRTAVPLPAPDEIFEGRCQWCWQVLPDGLLYKSYLAGTRESRISGALLYDTSDGWMLDSTMGGRAGILRYGSTGAADPWGWQLDIEGAAFIRQNLEEGVDVDSVDFRFGVPLTYRFGRWQWKAGYYHISAHVGDEFLARNPGFRRINYVRDSLFYGLGYYLNPDLRLYSEVGWAFKTDGGAEPWEFQFGADYSPAINDGLQGAPFAAVNVHLREEVDYGGGLNLMAGWRWKGPLSGSTLRFGLQYYNGKKSQYAFFDEHEELIGFGLWYDY